MYHLVLVGCPPSSLRLIEWTRSQDLFLTVIEKDLDEPMRPLVDEYLPVDHTDIGVVVRTALDLDRRRPVNGILPGTELGVVPCAAAATVLDLPGASYQAAVATRRKTILRRRLDAAEVPGPRWAAARLGDHGSLAEAAAAVGYPLVVKPNDLYGGLGVRLVTNLDELLAAAQEVSTVSIDPQCVLEKYLEGTDVSVEALNYAGEMLVCTLTDDVTTGPPHFVQIGHSIPSRLPSAIRSEVEAIARAAHRALGLSWGVSQTEVKITERGCRIVEMAGRLGGDKVKFMTEAALGIDMFAGSIEVALGHKPDVVWREPIRGAANRFFQPRPGRLEAIRGLEDARKMPGIESVTLYATTFQEEPKLGQMLTPFRSLFDRVGFVLATADSVDEAVCRAETARDCVTFVTSSPETKHGPTPRNRTA